MTRSATSAHSAFLRRVSIDAPADQVFDAIATLDGLRGWWTPFVDGSTSHGHDVRFEFEGLDPYRSDGSGTCSTMKQRS